MKNIQIFSNTELGNIRVYKKGTDVWFVAMDVAEILGYSETSKMLRRLDDDEKQKIEPTVLGCANSMARSITIITESGLYNAILGSKLPKAKNFKKWVISKVIPSIRKHGAYMTDTAIEKGLADNSYFTDLAEKLKVERQARIAAEQKKLILEANNLKLQKNNNLLLIENKVLTADILSWDAIPAIRKMINKMAKVLGDDRSNFGGAWALFYERMYYDYGKNFKSRKGKFEEKFRTEEEISLGLKVVTALCRENYVDVSDVLGNLKMVN